MIDLEKQGVENILKANVLTYYSVFTLDVTYVVSGLGKTEHFLSVSWEISQLLRDTPK